MVLFTVTVGLPTSANTILIVHPRHSQVNLNLDSSSQVFLEACLLDVGMDPHRQLPSLYQHFLSRSLAERLTIAR